MRSPIAPGLDDEEAGGKRIVVWIGLTAFVDAMHAELLVGFAWYILPEPAAVAFQGVEGTPGSGHYGM